MWVEGERWRESVEYSGTAMWRSRRVALNWLHSVLLVVVVSTFLTRLHGKALVSRCNVYCTTITITITITLPLLLLLLLPLLLLLLLLLLYYITITIIITITLPFLLPLLLLSSTSAHCVGYSFRINNLFYV